MPDLCKKKWSTQVPPHSCCCVGWLAGPLARWYLFAIFHLSQFSPAHLSFANFSFSNSMSVKIGCFQVVFKLLWFIKDRPWCNRWDGFIPVKKYLAFPVTNIMHRYFCKIETKPRFCLLVPSVYVFIYCFCLKYLGKN